MLEFPALFRCIAFVLEKIVAPLTMVWFTYYWSHLPPGEIEPERERKISSAGVTSGFLLALPSLLICFCFFKPVDPLPVAQTSLSRSQTSMEYIKDLGASPSLGFCLALVIGFTVGILTACAGNLKAQYLGKKEDTLPSGAKVNVIARPWPLFWFVAVTRSLGVASLVIYYTGASYRAPHLWLMWAYLALLIGYRFVAPFEAMK